MPSPENRRDPSKIQKVRLPEPQLSFLRPDDAETVHMLRRFVAEAARIYESQTGQSLEDALTIRSPADAYNYLRLEMEGLDQEQLRTINLNTRNKILSSHLIYQGTLNSTPVRLAELFRPAIIANASGIIVAHSHPSGDPSPSREDIAMTEELVRAGTLLGIEVLDHLVIGHSRFVSLKERGLGFTK